MGGGAGGAAVPALSLQAGGGPRGKHVWEIPKRKQIVDYFKDKGRVHLCWQINQVQVKVEGDGGNLWNVWVNPPDSRFLKGRLG